jgi:hypothetical protein
MKQESFRRNHPNSDLAMRRTGDGSDMYSLCTICLEEYKAGDEIAWSRNPDCHHVYHTHCVVEWLMTRTECPICRNSYAVVDEESIP